MSPNAATTGETMHLLRNIDSSPGLVSLSARSLSFAGSGSPAAVVGGYGITTSTSTHSFTPLKKSSRSLSFRGGGGTPSGFINNSNVVAMNAWIPTALACALSYSLYNISIKKASNDINPILGGVILQFVAAILGTLVYYISKQIGFSEGDDPIFNDVGEVVEYLPEGIKWSMYAGIFVGLAEILSFVVNGKGVPATQSIPVIIGGSVLFGTILGNVFLAEDVSPRGWAGVALITIGIAIVSMEDSGGREVKT